MTRTIVFIAMGLLIGVHLSGCDLSTGIHEEQFLGAIGYPDNLDITMPDTVQVGQDFTVTVRTIGPTGCWEWYDTVVGVTDLTATIHPYDLVRSGGDLACTQAIVEIMHTETLTFDQTGVAQIEIIGRDGTAERSVVVE